MGRIVENSPNKSLNHLWCVSQKNSEQKIGSQRRKTSEGTSQAVYYGMWSDLVTGGV